MGRKKIERTKEEATEIRRATYRKSKAKARAKTRHVAVDLPIDLGNRIDQALKQDNSLTIVSLIQQSLSNHLDSLGL